MQMVWHDDEGIQLNCWESLRKPLQVDSTRSPAGNIAMFSPIISLNKHSRFTAQMVTK